MVLSLRSATASSGNVPALKLPATRATGFLPTVKFVSGKIVEPGTPDRKSTRLNSSHSQISYAVFCLKKKNIAHVSDFQVIGTKRVLVELKGLLCVAHDQVWRACMKSWTNSFDCPRHRTRRRRGILD